jgi:hypothetical protein
MVYGKIGRDQLCRELVAFDKLPLVILYGNGWLMLDSSPCWSSKVSHRSQLMRKNEGKCIY